MNSDKIPKKILLIRDCTFILPNDFNGTIEDAFKEFLKYREENIQSATYVSDTGLFSTFDLILYANNDKRVCGEYSLLEFKNGRYENVLEIKNE